MTSLRPLSWVLAAAVIVALTASTAGAAAGTFNFSNTPLLREKGDSEPAIWIGANGTMAITALPWLRDTLADFATPLWLGSFGSTPTFRGLLDASLLKPGAEVAGALDADVDIGSTGTLHATTLIGLVNPTFTSATLGVSAITCPNATAAGFSLSGCAAQIIDTAGADRQWVTSDGTTVYISYHDSGNSALIHVQRSDDDGFIWKKVGDPVVGQDGVTANSTFNNTQGPIVADSSSGNVYAIFAAGVAGLQKGTTAKFNNIYVSRSKDKGQTWSVTRVFSAAVNDAQNNVFPALAVDPTNGRLQAAWSDAHRVRYSTSDDQGATWSTAKTVNVAPADTAVFPWVTARAGTVDVVYYGTDASSKDDPEAIWNVYLAQTTDNGRHFAQSRVSNKPNHRGVICTRGTACAPGTRNLLDLFEVAIDPGIGRAAVIYTDDFNFTTTTGDPLPQIVLAQQGRR